VGEIIFDPHRTDYIDFYIFNFLGKDIRKWEQEYQYGILVSSPEDLDYNLHKFEVDFFMFTPKHRDNSASVREGTFWIESLRKENIIKNRAKEQFIDILKKWL